MARTNQSNFIKHSFQEEQKARKAEQQNLNEGIGKNEPAMSFQLATRALVMAINCSELKCLVLKCLSPCNWVHRPSMNPRCDTQHNRKR